MATKACDDARAAAKTARGNARKRGASADEIVAIDAEADAKRAAIARHGFTIAHMPAANTVIVEAAAAAPPAAHVCSAECTAEICPRARALLEAAMSDEAAVLIIAAFGIWALGGCDGGDAFR